MIEPDQVFTTRSSGKAVGAFFMGLLSVACGFLALVSESDVLLLGVVLFWVLALVLGICGLREIKRSVGGLCGKGFAAWGIGIAPTGLVLGFLLLPAT